MTARAFVLLAFARAILAPYSPSAGTHNAADFQFVNQTWRPRIWVAEEKHANYKTQNQCDAGAYYRDTCDANTIMEVVDVKQWRDLGNSGSFGVPIRDCVTSEITGGYLGYQECFWSGSKFSGWRGTTDGAGPYRQSLDAYGF